MFDLKKGTGIAKELHQRCTTAAGAATTAPVVCILSCFALTCKILRSCVVVVVVVVAVVVVVVVVVVGGRCNDDETSSILQKKHSKEQLKVLKRTFTDKGISLSLASQVEKLMKIVCIKFLNYITTHGHH